MIDGYGILILDFPNNVASGHKIKLAVDGHGETGSRTILNENRMFFAGCLL